MMWTLYRWAHCLAHPWIHKELKGYPVLPKREGGLWVHAASVGELHGIAPFLKQLKGNTPLWLSVTTPRGFERAVELLGNEVDVFRFPLDHPSNITAVFSYHPRALMLVETELWPHLLREAIRHRLPLFLLNGRLTHATFRAYRMVGVAPLLRSFQKLFVQTQWDGWRFWKLGAQREAIRVTGNWKRYLPPLVSRTWTRRDLGLTDEPVVLYASVREKEWEGLLATMAHVKRKIPNIRWILAPRHFSWLSHLFEGLRGLCMTVHRWSTTKDLQHADVLVVDRLGELAGLYGVADIVIMGGTFADYGGHNLMEPIHARRPVFLGPFTHHVEDMREAILQYHAGMQTDMEGLGPVLDHFFADPAFREHLVRGAMHLQKVSQMRVRQILDEIQEALHGIS